jgi:hypothetical protein
MTRLPARVRAALPTLASLAALCAAVVAGTDRTMRF